MTGVPLGFTEGSEDGLDQFDSQLQALEQKLLDASARRIHDFERRLEHEWIALRQLHEEPLKTLEHPTTVITESLLVVREALTLIRTQVRLGQSGVFPSEAEPPSAQLPAGPSRAITPLLLAVLAALVIFSVYTRWSLGTQLRDTAARAASAEQRGVELQLAVEKQTRSTEETVQQLTGEARASAMGAQRLVNVLAASDVRMFPLRGLRNAAAATGQGFFSPSQGVAVNVSRLPATSATQVYQVWLVTTWGSVSLGFAVPDRQGRIDAAFETPPELLRNFTGLMLSLEPIGGSTKPTGPIVVAS